MRIAVGIALPLVIVSLAYGLWWTSDRLLYIGPLDRAAFGWIVVVPLWLSAPVVAGFAWKSLRVGQSRVVAFIVGSCITVASGFAFWQSIGTPFDCGFGTVTPAINFLPQTIVMGTLVGAGLAIDGLLVERLARAGVRWSAVIVGVGTEVAFLAVALFAVVAAYEGHTCYVPGPNYPVTP